MPPTSEPYRLVVYELGLRFAEPGYEEDGVDYLYVNIDDDDGNGETDLDEQPLDVADPDVRALELTIRPGSRLLHEHVP